MTDISGKIIEANDNFCDISGYSREELLGQNHRILKSGAHSPMFFKQMWSDISSGKIWVGETENTTKSGQSYWVHGVITPLFDENNNINRYLAIRFDITERKKSEQKLIQASKMATLGEMGGNIAHEVNNPLTVILGKTEQLLRYNAQGKMDHDVTKAYLEKIRDTGLKISNIIQGLRSFSRNAENDPMESSSITTAIQETIDLCTERFKQKSIKFSADINADAKLECRPSQIAQIIMNLLGNSIDAIESLPEKWVKLSLEANDNEVIISVMDSGPGIPSAIVEKLMNPFFTTKPTGEGTGLGLSISRGIAEAHHGVLSYDASSANTKFVLRLPLKQPIKKV
jgi:PAS domain S-box-containing protein